MANRYLVATGNWNSTSTWSATSGGSSGASVPVGGDAVYIDKNYIVTLTADAECDYLSHTDGKLALSNYTLSLGANTSLGYYGSFISSGSSTRTIDLGSGTLHIADQGLTNPSEQLLILSGSNLTFTAGTSLLILDRFQDDSSTSVQKFDTLSKTFNDVKINLGVNGSNSLHLNITGSPTFRSLIIQSKNSAAHTVNFDNSAVLNVNKFVAIGSGSSNKLTLVGNADGVSGTQINLNTNATSYGQFVYSNGVLFQTFSSNIKAYLGSNSTQSTGLYGSMGWLLQDPPKISTLVDPLTTSPGSNTNWTVTGTVNQITSGHDGGGYSLTPTGKMMSTNTFDILDNDVIIELPATQTNGLAILFGWDEGDGNVYNGNSILGWGLMTQSYQIHALASIYRGSYWDQNLATISSGVIYIKMHINTIDEYTATGYYYTSVDGSSWTFIGFGTHRDFPVVFLKSTRIYSNYIGSTSSSIGSINPVLSTPNTSNFFFQ